MSASAAVRSASRERLVQSQILCLPPNNSSRDLMARDARDAWDYYGPPAGATGPSGSSPSAGHQSALNNSSTSSTMSPKMMNGLVSNNAPYHTARPAVAPGGPAIINNVRQTQSPAGCNALSPIQQQQQQPFQQQQQQRNNVNSGGSGLRDPRFSLLSSSSTSPKVENTNGTPLHAPSPQRLLYSPAGQCHPQPQRSQQTQQQQQQQQVGGGQHQQLLQGQSSHQPHQSQQQQQTGPQQPVQPQQPQQQQMIHHLQYPYYNAKLESLTHRMPNLSFEGLGQQQQQQQQPAATGAVVSRAEHVHASSSLSPAVVASSSLSSNSSNSPSSAASSPSSSASSTPGSSSSSASSAAAAVASDKPEPLHFLSAGHAESAANESVNATRATTTSPLPLPREQETLLVPQVSTSSCAEVSQAGNEAVAAAVAAPCGLGDSSADVAKLPLFSLHRHHTVAESLLDAGATGLDSLSSMDNENLTKSVRTSPSVAKRTTTSDPTTATPLSRSNNNKDLLSAEASYLFRLADPSMMLVRGDSATAAATGEESTVKEVNDGGSNSSTSSRTAATGADLGAMSPESVTDCGSLSKSSSDGDPVGVVSRKRPPTKLKSRRRNILSFPHHISVDELRLIQVR